MRIVSLIPLIPITLLLSSCGHKGDIQGFGSELRTLARDISSAVDADPSPDGVREGYKDLKARQKPLLDQWNRLKTAKLSQDDKSQLLTAVVDSQVEITGISTKHLAETHRNPLFYKALVLLQRDFRASFNPEEVR